MRPDLFNNKRIKHLILRNHHFKTLGLQLPILLASEFDGDIQIIKINKRNGKYRTIFVPPPALKKN